LKCSESGTAFESIPVIHTQLTAIIQESKTVSVTYVHAMVVDAFGSALLKASHRHSADERPHCAPLESISAEHMVQQGKRPGNCFAVGAIYLVKRVLAACLYR
jgi:hypothetical protein